MSGAWYGQPAEYRERLILSLPYECMEDGNVHNTCMIFLAHSAAVDYFLKTCSYIAGGYNSSILHEVKEAMHAFRKVSLCSYVHSAAAILYNSAICL